MGGKIDSANTPFGDNQPGSHLAGGGRVECPENRELVGQGAVEVSVAQSCELWCLRLTELMSYGTRPPALAKGGAGGVGSAIGDSRFDGWGAGLFRVGDFVGRRVKQPTQH